MNNLPIPDLIEYVDFRVTFTLNGSIFTPPSDDPLKNDDKIPRLPDLAPVSNYII